MFEASNETWLPCRCTIVRRCAQSHKALSPPRVSRPPSLGCPSKGRLVPSTHAAQQWRLSCQHLRIFSCTGDITGSMNTASTAFTPPVSDEVHGQAGRGEGGYAQAQRGERHHEKEVLAAQQVSTMHPSTLGFWLIPCGSISLEDLTESGRKSLSGISGVSL